MTILNLVREPSKSLHEKCSSVLQSDLGQSLTQRLSDMAETMYNARGVGLAGPQIGDNRRILVADIGYVTSLEAAQYGKSHIKMINPEITFNEGEFQIIEGCLSIPDFELSMKRPSFIKVSFLDETGATHSEEFRDFAAAVICHEIDHLNGTTLLSHSSQLKRSRYLKSIRKSNAKMQK